MSKLKSAVLWKHSCTGSVIPSVQTETVGAEGPGSEAFRRPISCEQLCCQSSDMRYAMDEGISGHQVGVQTLCPRALGRAHAHQLSSRSHDRVERGLRRQVPYIPVEHLVSVLHRSADYYQPLFRRENEIIQRFHVPCMFKGAQACQSRKLPSANASRTTRNIYCNLGQHQTNSLSAAFTTAAVLSQAQLVPSHVSAPMASALTHRLS
jgi:hypothetical protein